MCAGNQKLPFQLDEGMGSVRRVQEECPGVFHVTTNLSTEHFCREHYVVTAEAVPNIISLEVLAYGRLIGEDAYEFEHEVGGSGWELVAFEIMRYKIKQGITLGNHESIYCTAVYDAERYPEYYGGHIPPRTTPWGLTIRWKKASEGIFFLETEHCEWVLALAQPIWSIDLPDVVKEYGQSCEADLQMGAEEAVYRYFRGSNIAPALFELLDSGVKSGLKNYIYGKEALETYLNVHCPEYVLWYNSLELSGHGKGDVLSDLLAAFGYSVESEEETEQDREKRIVNCIHYYPDFAGSELLRLPK